MTDVRPNLESLERLLTYIELVPRAPDTTFLTETVAAFMRHVPFENISKRYYHRTLDLNHLPTFEQYVDGLERCHFGGTCITNNTFLNMLLNHLGFDARLCGADMNQPNCHFVNMVTVEGREFLIDAGYAAPFVTPLPRDLPHDVEVALGRDRYVLRPQDAQGRSRMDLYRDNELVHGYTAKPIARYLEYFDTTIRDSFKPTSVFMSSLLLVKIHSATRTTAVRNLTVIESEGDSFSVEHLPDPSVLPETIEQHFGIPAAMVATATEGLDLSVECRA